MIRRIRLIPTRLKSWFRLDDPNSLVRVTWTIFVLFSPFLALTLWHQAPAAWIAMVGAGMWGFTFSNAYLNRLYYRTYQLQNENLHEMLDQITQAYYMLHEHCPNCGARLKPPPEIRQ